MLTQITKGSPGGYPGLPFVYLVKKMLDGVSR